MKRRGEMTLSFVIFLVLTTMFLAMLFYFVYSSSSGAFVYEQIYAKKIALAIDASSPKMEIILDVKTAIDAAKKAKVSPKFSVDDKKGFALVSLGSRRGYSQPFFSNYSVTTEMLEKENKLKIIVKSK